MGTTITLRDDLLKLARAEARAKTVTGAVNEALEDWARRMRVDRIRAMAGKVHFDGDLNELRNLELKETDQDYAKRSR